MADGDGGFTPDHLREVEEQVLRALAALDEPVARLDDGHHAAFLAGFLGRIRRGGGFAPPALGVGASRRRREFRRRRQRLLLLALERPRALLGGDGDARRGGFTVAAFLAAREVHRRAHAKVLLARRAVQFGVVKKHVRDPRARDDAGGGGGGGRGAGGFQPVSLALLLRLVAFAERLETTADFAYESVPPRDLFHAAELRVVALGIGDRGGGSCGARFRRGRAAHESDSSRSALARKPVLDDVERHAVALAEPRARLVQIGTGELERSGGFARPGGGELRRCLVPGGGELRGCVVRVCGARLVVARLVVVLGFGGERDATAVRVHLRSAAKRPDDGPLHTLRHHLGRAILRGEGCETRRGGFTVLVPGVGSRRGVADEKLALVPGAQIANVPVQHLARVEEQLGAGAVVASHESVTVAEGDDDAVGHLAGVAAARSATVAIGVVVAPAAAPVGRARTGGRGAPGVVPGVRGRVVRGGGHLREEDAPGRPALDHVRGDEAVGGRLRRSVVSETIAYRALIGSVLAVSPSVRRTRRCRSISRIARVDGRGRVVAREGVGVRDARARRTGRRRDHAGGGAGRPRFRGCQDRSSADARAAGRELARIQGS